MLSSALILICLGKNKGAAENCRTINTLYPQSRVYIRQIGTRKVSQKLDFCRLMYWADEQTSKLDQNFTYITKMSIPS